MPVVEESVFIARPPQDVFDFIADSANLTVWDVSIVKAEQIGTGPVGLGTRSRGTSKIMGRHFDWTTEFTDFEPPKHIISTCVEGQIKFSVSEVLEPAPGGTKLTYRIDAESGLGGVFGRLADPFITKAQARTVRANLETLAELLVQQPGS
jgi:uncharacterized protein YndB with AHSA1/START domain